EGFREPGIALQHDDHLAPWHPAPGIAGAGAIGCALRRDDGHALAHHVATVGRAAEGGGVGGPFPGMARPRGPELEVLARTEALVGMADRPGHSDHRLAVGDDLDVAAAVWAGLGEDRKLDPAGRWPRQGIAVAGDAECVARPAEQVRVGGRPAVV